MRRIWPAISGKQGWFWIPWCFLYNISRSSFCFPFLLSNPSLIQILMSSLFPPGAAFHLLIPSSLWGCQQSRSDQEYHRERSFHLCYLLRRKPSEADLPLTRCLCKCPVQWNWSRENWALMTWQLLSFYHILKFIAHRINLLSPRKETD